jgi:hypothetical protein
VAILQTNEPVVNTTLQADASIREIPQFGMWIGFLYILYFIALYVWATSFGNIFHEVVNRYVPAALESEEARRGYMYFGADSIVRWSLASMLIFYPIFATIHLFISRLRITRPETVNIRVRKILIYITLVGTALISAWQLVKFVFAFLNGSIDTRTMAHVGVTLLISIVIFISYLMQVRRDRNV